MCVRRVTPAALVHSARGCKRTRDQPPCHSSSSTFRAQLGARDRPRTSIAPMIAGAHTRVGEKRQCAPKHLQALALQQQRCCAGALGASADMRFCYPRAERRITSGGAALAVLVGEINLHAQVVQLGWLQRR